MYCKSYVSNFHSGDPFTFGSNQPHKAQCLVYVPPSLTFKQHCVSVIDCSCFHELHVIFTAIIPLKIINFAVFKPRRGMYSVSLKQNFSILR